jgi:hypothetical protein
MFSTAMRIALYSSAPQIANSRKHHRHPDTSCWKTGSPGGVDGPVHPSTTQWIEAKIAIRFIFVQLPMRESNFAISSSNADWKAAIASSIPAADLAYTSRNG